MATKDISKVTSPEEFFGFKMGSDRKIARWDKIVEYFRKLEAESDKIKVIDMGPSTEGNPFLLTIISSAENLKQLEYYKEINAKITDPRGLTEDAVKELVKEGKAIVCQSMSLHATEIGGTQMAPELAWDLLSCDSEDNRAILDNVIFLMVPCFNPGQEWCWYNKLLARDEGTMTRSLSQYGGINNKLFCSEPAESRYMAQILSPVASTLFRSPPHGLGARLFWHPIRCHRITQTLVARGFLVRRPYAYTLEEHGKTDLNGAHSRWGHPASTDRDYQYSRHAD